MPNPNPANIAIDDPIFASIENSLVNAGVSSTNVATFIDDAVALINTNNTPDDTSTASLIVEQINALSSTGYWQIDYPNPQTAASGAAATSIETYNAADNTTSPQGIIYFNPDITALNSGNSATIEQQAAIFVGVLAYELGHAEDYQGNTIRYGGSTNGGDGLGLGAQVALQLLGEGKSLYNKYQISNTLGTLLDSDGTTFVPPSNITNLSSEQAVLNGAADSAASTVVGTNVNGFSNYWDIYVTKNLASDPTVESLLQSLTNATVTSVSNITFTQNSNSTITMIITSFGGTVGTVQLPNGNSVTVSGYSVTFGNYGAVTSSGLGGGQGLRMMTSPSQGYNSGQTDQIFDFANGSSLEDIYNPTTDIAQSGSQSLTGIAEEVATFSGSSGSGSASNVTYYTASDASSVIDIASGTPAPTLANDVVMFDGKSIAGNINASTFDQYGRSYSLSGTTLTITGTGGSANGDTLTIDNFANGDFGVNLPYATTSLPVPATAINNDGVTAGSNSLSTYTDNDGAITSSVPVGENGYLADFIAEGINDSGVMVGQALYSGDEGPAFVSAVDNGGVLTPIVDPNAPTTVVNNEVTFSQTFAVAINDSGVIVGAYSDSSFNLHGFVDNGGSFTTINDPSTGATETVVNGINDNDVIVGTYTDASGVTQGFMDNDGVFTTITDPNATGAHGTQLTSINDSGVIAGNYINASGAVQNFTYDDGTFANTNTGITAPVEVTGINDDGEEVLSSSTLAFTATDQTPSASTQSTTESNSSSSVPDNTDAATYGSGNNITTGNNDNLAVYGDGNTATTGDGGTVYASGANNTVNAGENIDVIVDASSTWASTYLSGDDSSAADSGTYSYIELDGNSDSATMNGNNGSTQVYGGSEDVAVTGNNDSIYDNGTGGSNITIGSYSNNAYVYANGSFATDTGVYNYVELDGNSDSAAMNGNSGEADIYGGNANVTVGGSYYNVYDLGTGDSTIALNSSNGSGIVYATGSSATDNGTGNYIELDGTSETSTMNGTGGDTSIFGLGNTVTVGGNNNSVYDQGSGSNTIYLEGNTNHGNMYNNGDTCYDSGTDNTEQLSGNDITVDMTGTGGIGTIYGTDDTINVAGTGNTAFDLSDPTGENTISLEGSGNSGIIYNPGSDTITVGGSSNSLTLESGVGSGSTAISGTGDTVQIAGTSSEGVTFDLDAMGTLLLQMAQDYTGTVAGLANDDYIDLTNFQFSNGATISNVTGTGAAGTDTNLTITDGTITAQLALMNQFANQFAVSASAYTLTADSTADNAGTLLQLAAGH